MKMAVTFAGMPRMLASALLVGLLAGCASNAVSEQPTDPAVQPVRHIIVFVADGSGYHHMEAASLYQFGWRGGQVYQDFPVRLAAATYPHGGSYDPERAWEDFEYFKEGATDSAAAATAMSTGVKTKSGRVGIGPDGERLTHLAHRAQRRGMAAGVISSGPIVDATPTSFAIHAEDRWDFESIARKMIEESALDMILAGGHPLYDGDGQRFEDPEDHEYFLVGGKELWEKILAGEAGGQRPWRLVETREAFLDLIEAETDDRILGIPRTHRTLQYDRGGNGEAEPFEVPFIEGGATLEEKTRAGLNVLSQQGDGFFVMIEAGAIDWAGHHNNSPRLIEEHVDFDNAVKAAVEWVETNSSWDETLMIVTSDHECGYLLGPDSGPEASPMWQPVRYRGKGEMPGFEWYSDNHTNKLVPFFARGAAAERFREHTIDIDPQRGPYLHLRAIGRLGIELIEHERPATSQLISRPADAARNQ